MEKYVNYEKRGSVAVIEFNHPEVLNAYDNRMMTDLITAFWLARQDEEVKAVVWKGRGRAWNAGANIKFLAELKGLEGVKGFFRFIELEEESTHVIMDCTKPVIAAINGYALGGGCEYAMLADIRIAAEGVKFGFPETTIGGVVTHAGTKLLPALVGLSKAKELVLTGEMIDAVEAERIGLISRVVPPEELDKVAMEMAEKIALSPPLAVSTMKYALDNAPDWSYEATLKYESHASVQLQAQGLYTDRVPGKPKS
jgi:enoyl-CoA hydratase